jgi:hypothetical protein
MNTKIVIVMLSIGFVSCCLPTHSHGGYCDDAFTVTSCSNCGFWPWNDKCDWVEVSAQSGVVYKNYVTTNCDEVCAEENPTTCNYGFDYAIGSTKWSWESGVEINLASYVTFKGQYNSGTNATTVTITCSGAESISPGNCGHRKYSSIVWDYEQKGYKKRVYDWRYQYYAIPEPGYCDVVYHNPHICTPCVGSVATGEEVSGCSHAAHTVFTVPSKMTDASVCSN